MIVNPTDDVHPHTIPLQLEGTVSYFEYYLPTSAKFEDDDIPHLELRAVTPAWDHYDMDFVSLKESHHDFRGHLISAVLSDGPCWIAKMGTLPADAIGGGEPHWKLSPVVLQYVAADVTDNDNFGMALEAAHQVVLV
jgi:hypothetical protein